MRGCLHLKNLTNLTYLDLAATDVSDVGLSYLAELTKLGDPFLAQTLGRLSVSSGLG